MPDLLHHHLYVTFQISADPSDINVLPGYDKDPRVVTNLIDGINRTRDDTHMWLAPFTYRESHWIKLVFEKSVEVAMVRIWVSKPLSCVSFKAIFCKIGPTLQKIG